MDHYFPIDLAINRVAQKGCSTLDDQSEKVTLVVCEGVGIYLETEKIIKII